MSDGSISSRGSEGKDWSLLDRAVSSSWRTNSILDWLGWLGWLQTRYQSRKEGEGCVWGTRRPESGLGWWLGLRREGDTCQRVAYVLTFVRHNRNRSLKMENQSKAPGALECALWPNLYALLTCSPSPSSLTLHPTYHSILSTTAEVKLVVNWLRNKAGLKTKVGVLGGKRVDYFKGKLLAWWLALTGVVRVRTTPTAHLASQAG